MKIRYFDHAATTPLKEDVLREMLPYFLVEYGNPSSIYSLRKTIQKGNRESKTKSGRSN